MAIARAAMQHQCGRAAQTRNLALFHGHQPGYGASQHQRCELILNDGRNGGMIPAQPTQTCNRASSDADGKQMLLGFLPLSC